SGDSYSISAECDVDEDERPDGKTWADFIPELVDIRAEQIQNFSTPGASAEEDLDEQLARFSGSNRSGDNLSLSSATDNLILSSTTGNLSLSSATFVLFLGINDCGQNTADRLGPIVDKVIDAAQSLYTRFGARTFVFVDIPPTDRAPAAVRMECGDTVQGRVNAWNDHLRAATQRTSDTQAKTTLFSSHEVITDVLDAPVEYGFPKEDVAKEGGEIWLDDLHLSSAVHRILAERFLERIPLPTRS
ncbi:hypothetical protein GGG16DRAFT_68375, partial [Schizophyllum commune]